MDDFEWYTAHKYQGPINIDTEKRDLHLRIAALEAENEALRIDLKESVDLLTAIFDEYEDGPACYEHPDECGGFIGVAVNIDRANFDRCVAILNRLNPHKETNRG